MDAIIDRLVRVAKRCDRAAKAFTTEEFERAYDNITKATQSVGASSSRSWIGSQATFYIRDFRPSQPDEHFDSEWGQSFVSSNRTTGDWCQYDPSEVEAEIASRAGMQDIPSFAAITNAADVTFNTARDELLPVLDALLAGGIDATVLAKRDEMAKLSASGSPKTFSSVMGPKSLRSRDSFSMHQGMWTPPHLAVVCRLMSIRSRQHSLEKLAGLARYVANYLELRVGMKGSSVGKSDGKVFIGHGHSAAWKDLKDFLRDKLDLEWEEYNRQSTAGLSTKERLEAMMETATFAFIVMTAEDEQADGALRARENVIHEVGLFQGRLSFERAIVLLEDGCGEFSNIKGIGQIRFPKGNILANSEEIRDVLRREGLI